MDAFLCLFRSFVRCVFLSFVRSFVVSLCMCAAKCSSRYICMYVLFSHGLLSLVGSLFLHVCISVVR